MNEIETVNAVIEDADLDIERVLTFWIHLGYGGSGQGFGGYVLGGEFGCRAIKCLLETVGVEKWSQLRGKTVRVKRTYSKVHAIGNYLEDKWFSPEELAKELGLR